MESRQPYDSDLTDAEWQYLELFRPSRQVWRPSSQTHATRDHQWHLLRHPQRRRLEIASSRPAALSYGLPLLLVVAPARVCGKTSMAPCVNWYARRRGETASPAAPFWIVS